MGSGSKEGGTRGSRKDRGMGGSRGSLLLLCLQLLLPYTPGDVLEELHKTGGNGLPYMLHYLSKLKMYGPGKQKGVHAANAELFCRSNTPLIIPHVSFYFAVAVAIHSW